MNLTSIPYKLCLMILLSLFFINVKFVSAQELLQPEVGTITSINAGTDRIIDMLQQENMGDYSSNDDINKKNEKKTINSNEDIEIFYKNSESDQLKNDNEEKDIEVFNSDIPSKVKIDPQNSHHKRENKSNPTEIKKTKIMSSISSGIQKVDTGNNGEIKNKINGVDIGITRELKTSSGKLSIGSVIDYNHNDYDNKISGIKGEGDSNSLMFGIVAKQIRDDGIYYEGSVRFGRSKTEFKTDDYKIGEINNFVHYEESAPVYAGHTKFGRIIKMNEKNSADIYGIYAFSHQDRVSLRLSTGETHKIGSIDSNRLRVGCRISTNVSRGKVYYGLAYQYEGSAKIKSRYSSGKTVSASAKGSIGLMELGYMISADRNKTLNMDIKAAGFTGRQKGFTVQAQLVKLL